MTKVALLWHMHQPFYEDLVTREHILPWVRLHALKDYYGMVALLREFPRVRVTFNLVPSMLVQLEDFAANRAQDQVLALGLKPASELTPADAAFIVENFFHAQRQRMIDPFPRYAELFARRGGSMPATADARAAAARFSTADLRDLQVWQKLVWIDPMYVDGDARVRALVAKGRDFTEDDKAILRDVELEILNNVVPEYRAAAARGQVELSTSPFYHPILPLLCDTDVYLRTHPDATRPRQRFAHPEDAAEQLARAIACHRRLFGQTPSGLWPSEGSVSDAIVPLVADAGFRWMATDELILARTLGLTFTRDAAGHLEQPERLYAPYVVAVGGTRVACTFRDHVLSDLIGFTYSGWSADAAADDFVARLVEAGRRYTQRTGGEEAVLPIILDGENAWEHFEGGGRPFLRALYGRLEAHPDLVPVTMGEACAAASRELPGIFPGSWIDANFYIWIGHADDQRAWGQLADARAALDTPGTARPDAVAAAREEVLIAEGSDWCWWYGDDHSSAHDLDFDELYRRHLRNVYRLLDKAVPDELFVSNISRGAPPAEETPPCALITPTIDGEATSYFEWLGAGALETRLEPAGTMHRIDKRPPLVTLVQFAFDRERLYVRLDGAKPIVDLLGDGFEFSLKFLRPDGVRFSVRQDAGRLVASFWDRTTVPEWVQRGAGTAVVAAGTVLECGLPLADLGVGEGDPVSFLVAVYDASSNELERHPANRAIETAVPDARFVARNWAV